MKFKNIFLFLPLILILLIIYLPSVFLPWSLIDDGNRLLIGEKMTQSFKTGDYGGYFSPSVDKPIGRFRPSYWIYHQINLVLLGKSALLHHAGRILLLLIFLFTFYKIIKKYGNKTIALLSSLLFLIFPGTIENWWRLGPQEPLMMALGSISLWFLLIKKNLPLSLLFSLLFFTSKETSIFVLPTILYFLIFYNKKLEKKNKTFLFFSGILAAIVALISSSLIQSSGYSSKTSFELSFLSSNFVANLNHLIHFGHKYILILILIWLPLYFLNRKNKKPLLVISALLFISSFAIGLTWPHSLTRYLFPSVVFLSIVYAFFVSRLFKNKTISLFGFLVKGVVSLSIAFLFIYSFVYAWSITTNYFARERANHRYLEYVSQLPQGSKACVNLNRDENAREWFVETNRQLKVIYQSPLEIEYLSDCILNNDKNYYIFDWNNFRDIPPEELSILTAGYKTSVIDEIYMLPIGGIKPYLKILFKNPLDLLTIKKGFRERHWIWTIYHKTKVLKLPHSDN